MILVAIWVVAGLLVGVAAEVRGRRFVTWCLLALVLSPLLAFVVLVILPDLRLWPADPAEDRYLARADVPRPDVLDEEAARDGEVT